MIRRLERLDAAGLLQSAILELRRLGPLERERCLEWWRDALGASWEKTEDELARLMDADGYLAATSAFRRSQHWRTKGFERLGTAVLSASQPAFRQWNWIARSYAQALSDFAAERSAAGELSEYRAMPEMRLPRHQTVLKAIQVERIGRQEAAAESAAEFACHQWLRLEDVRSYRKELTRREAAFASDAQQLEGHAVKLSGGSWSPEPDRPIHERRISAQRAAAKCEQEAVLAEASLCARRLESDIERLRKHLG